jgi:hypothetical protein
VVKFPVLPCFFFGSILCFIALHMTAVPLEVQLQCLAHSVSLSVSVSRDSSGLFNWDFVVMVRAGMTGFQWILQMLSLRAKRVSMIFWYGCMIPASLPTCKNQKTKSSILESKEFGAMYGWSRCAPSTIAVPYQIMLPTIAVLYEQTLKCMRLLDILSGNLCHDRAVPHEGCL